MKRFCKLTLLATIATSASVQNSASAMAAGEPLAVDCVERNSEVARTSTETMIGWLGSFSGAYNRDDAFTVGAHGAMNRMFNSSGRLIHPIELANGIRSSDEFKGEKAKLVELGASGTANEAGNSYADRLASMLGTEVVGCDGIAYYMRSGLYFCASEPTETNEISTRLLPLGFAPKQLPMFVAFCIAEGTSPDPRILLSSQAVFGLFSDELAELEARAGSDEKAAFRLYLYYWIAYRDREAALGWLKSAADLGSVIARYNLAYEAFETDDPQQAEVASREIGDLLELGAALPDLRRFYERASEQND